jgi:cell division septal protein FtsQ
VRLVRGSRNRRGRSGVAKRLAERGVSRALVLRAVTVGLAVASAVWASPWIVTAVHDHPYFAVREVVVGTGRRLAASEVRQLAGIGPGTSIWDVDPRAMEERLVQHPWIRTARVRRHLPHRVVIQIREERPLAIVATDDHDRALYYVGAHGRLFARVGDGDALDFPYLTGLGEADLVGRTGFGPRAVRRALNLLRLVERRPAGLGAVSEVHVDHRRGLTLLPNRPAVPIELGWTGFDTKLERLPVVLAQWSGREAEIVAVSLLFDDQVIVRTRPQPPAPRRAANT